MSEAAPGVRSPVALAGGRDRGQRARRRAGRAARAWWCAERTPRLPPSLSYAAERGVRGARGAVGAGGAFIRRGN